jgi:alpha-beta hydrolase superfamily lysophospholipase
MLAQDVGATVPWVEEALTLEYSGVRMKAALTRPRDGRSRSAVLLVPGSLFLDVDGNMPAFNAYPHAYADLAHQLAGQGHAVLRYAKTGPGTGSEVVDSAAAAGIRHFAARVDIARAAADTLLAHVRGAPFVLAGHSEGAVVVALLGSRDARVRGVVSLSGPSVGLYDIMREQLPLPPGSPLEAYRTFDALVARLRAGEPLPSDVGRDPMTVMFSRIDANGVQYLTEIDRVNPVTELSRVESPVLIIQGGRDTSVRLHHAERLAAGRGAKRTQVEIFPELQHFYKRVAPDADPMTAFMIDTESDPAVARAIDRWITAQVLR